MRTTRQAWISPPSSMRLEAETRPAAIGNGVLSNATKKTKKSTKRQKSIVVTNLSFSKSPELSRASVERQTAAQVNRCICLCGALGRPRRGLQKNGTRGFLNSRHTRPGEVCIILIWLLATTCKSDRRLLFSSKGDSTAPMLVPTLDYTHSC